MEIKATLKKPYTDNERMGFIVQYNHGMCYTIEETETELQALGYTEEEIASQEKERIAKLFLTGADVERGIYQAKGMDFDDIIALVEHLSKGELDLETGEIINKSVDIDVKALKIELKANHFYRGNPYVNAVGTLLGFTSEQLDKFFETNDYTTLLPQSDKVEGESDKVSDTVEVEDATESNNSAE
jgi:uncharacterized protein YwgA